MTKPHHNRLLAALTEAEADRLSPHLEQVSLPFGETINESEGQLKHAYFPTTAIVSLLYVMEANRTIEVAMVGNDGLVGIPLFLGDGVTAYRAVVHNPGQAFRLEGPLLKQEFDRSGSFQSLLLRYTLTRLRQATQTAVCNRRHTTKQQFCRWLLLSLDRMQTREFNITQDVIAGALGVRRESVTAAALSLERSGLIRHHHGHITVVNRAGLEARACECYEAVKKVTRRLLPEATDRTTHVVALHRTHGGPPPGPVPP